MTLRVSQPSPPESRVLMKLRPRKSPRRRTMRGDSHALLLEIRSLLLKLLERLEQPRETREAYSVEEVAKLLGKTSWTVRQWCRLGRINATKKHERRGGAKLWSIAADEVQRIKDRGLLPIDPGRNGR